MVMYLLSSRIKRSFLILFTVQFTIFLSAQYFIHIGFDISNATDFKYCENLVTSHHEQIKEANSLISMLDDEKKLDHAGTYNRKKVTEIKNQMRMLRDEYTRINKKLESCI